MFDVVSQSYPFRHFAGESVRRTVLPLWNPHLLFGSPFLANMQSALFSPFTALFYVLPAPVAWDLGFPLRITVAGLFTALFARDVGSSSTGAIVAGMVFALSGFFVGYQGYPGVDSAVWLPLVFYAVNRLQRRPRWPQAVVAALAFVLPVLSGHPGIAVISVGTGAMFGLYRLVLPPSGSQAARVRYAEMLGVSAALGVGLAAAQLLPAIEWISHLSLLTQGGGGFTLPVSSLVGFVSRNTRVSPSPAGLPFYVGTLSLFFVPFAVFQRNRRDTAFLVLLVAVCFSAVFGLGPPYWLYRRLPFVRQVPNPYLLLVVEFSLAVLVGLGITAFELRRLDRRADRSWWAVVGLVSAVGGIGVWRLYAKVGQPWHAVGEIVRGPAGALALLAIGAVAVSPTIVRRLSTRVVSLGLLVVFALDLLSYSYGHAPFVTRSAVYPAPPLFEQLRAQDASIYRVGEVEGTYPRNLEMMFGLFAPNGLDFATEEDAGMLTGLAPRFGGNYLDLLASGVVRKGDHRLDVMNVKYIFATRNSPVAAALEGATDRFRRALGDGAVEVFENLSVLPRAFLVPTTGAVVLRDHARPFGLLEAPEFDPRTQVVVERALRARDSIPSPPAGSPGSASTVRYAVNDIRVAFHAEAASVLVLSDKFYPGWRVRLDGQKRRLLKVDGALKGVEVEPGEHVASFAFRPRSYRIGSSISLASVALALLVTVGRLLTPARRRQDQQRDSRALAMSSGSSKTTPRPEAQPR
jgi:hypothetical protein